GAGGGVVTIPPPGEPIPIEPEPEPLDPDVPGRPPDPVDLTVDEMERGLAKLFGGLPPEPVLHPDLSDRRPA
ncbi:MAG TPA: hypothetical protein VHW47_10305, partial [Acidimicrobiales bacterium]|nr:hypothetical protein [Acidimicrobiales bacterium]